MYSGSAQLISFEINCFYCLYFLYKLVFRKPKLSLSLILIYCYSILTQATHVHYVVHVGLVENADMRVCGYAGTSNWFNKQISKTH